MIEGEEKARRERRRRKRVNGRTVRSMKECHTISSLIKASERVSFLTEPSLMKRREKREKKGKDDSVDVDVEEEEALNQSVISFRESYNSASHLSLPSIEFD